jgi:hypothetical protein
MTTCESLSESGLCWWLVCMDDLDGIAQIASVYSTDAYSVERGNRPQGGAIWMKSLRSHRCV